MFRENPPLEGKVQVRALMGLEDLNWKLKEAALLSAASIKSDCELEGATLNKSPEVKHQALVKHNPYNTDPDRENGWQNEPDPTMPSLNPFAQARNLKMLKQSDVAEALSLKIVDIIRLEQGVLTSIPKYIVEYYTKELGMPKGWEAGYRMFQKMIRRSAPRPIHGVWQTPPNEFNFRRFRIYNWPTLSQTGWCKAFCVHPSSLYAIEKNVKQMLPHDILTALVEGNVMSEEQARQFALKIRQAAHNQRPARKLN
jgi:hypothetical protein